MVEVLGLNVGNDPREFGLVHVLKDWICLENLNYGIVFDLRLVYGFGDSFVHATKLLTDFVHVLVCQDERRAERVSEHIDGARYVHKKRYFSQYVGRRFLDLLVFIVFVYAFGTTTDGYHTVFHECHFFGLFSYFHELVTRQLLCLSEMPCELQYLIGLQEFEHLGRCDQIFMQL